jgi:mannose-6-phosphate isomerase
MNGIYKLQNEIMHYDWGSADYIPELLGIRNADGKPYAELWMGTHPRGPSLALLDDGKRPLSDFSGSLPFLFKVLAAERPLSIQVHPDKARAVAGYERENSLGIPLDAPGRSYKDPNHKPEILCALTPFRALCGFRKREAIKQRLTSLGCPAIKKLFASFDSDGALPESEAIKNFLRALFDLPDDERTEISSFIKENIRHIKNEHREFASELELVEKLEGIFPGDWSVLSPLYLNMVDLEHGEAIFVPPGTVHAYIHGAGIELMAASDNVIRGGLTPKHIDRAELFEAARFSPFMPDILKPKTDCPYRYPVPADDFSLVRMDNAGARADFPASSDSILVCVDGAVSICFEDGKRIEIGRGESVFISGEACKIFYLSGSFEAYIAR